MALGVDMACWAQDTALPLLVPMLRRAWIPMAQQEQEVQLALSDHRKVLEALERAYLVEDIALVGQDLAQLGVDMGLREEGKWVR